MTQYHDGSSSQLPTVHRYITTHDTSGKATFYEPPNGSEAVTLKRLDVAGFHVHYATTQAPVSFKDDKDIHEVFNPSAVETISNKNGSVVRMVDLQPGASSPMHRTTSLDYGVVLEGEVELVLEDWETGPVRRMKRGDVSVQRATMHAWRNLSKDNWSRMLYVLVDAEPVEVDGKVLGENYGGIVLPK